MLFSILYEEEKKQLSLKIIEVTKMREVYIKAAVALGVLNI